MVVVTLEVLPQAPHHHGRLVLVVGPQPVVIHQVPQVVVLTQNIYIEGSEVVVVHLHLHQRKSVS